MSTSLIPAGWPTLHALMVSLGLLVYVLTTHSFQRRRAPAAAISWVLSIVFIPYLAVPVYLIFGARKLPRTSGPTNQHGTAACITDDGWASHLAAAMGQTSVAPYQHLDIHADGHHAQQALFGLIHSAQDELCLSTFILRADAFGNQLMSHLITRARAGVRVRLMIDTVGHWMAGRPNLRALKAAGVQIALFGPVFPLRLNSRVNLRNHRKLVVADGQRMWCGGRNFATEYFEGQASGAPAWQDLSFTLQGPLAKQALALFERDWHAASGQAGSPAHHVAAAVDGPAAQLIACGPDQSDDTVYNLLVTGCYRARTRILAVSPYFVPDNALLMALCLAARRGVVVDLVLPKSSNHSLTDFVRHRAMRELAAAGARVWLTPYMLHAKAVVIDQSLALAGSVNLDARSLFLNYEVMVAFYDAQDVQRFADQVQGHCESATLYSGQAPGLIRDLAEGLLLWLAFQL